VKICSHSYTTVEDIFNLINLFIVKECFCWKQCVDICTYDVRLMVGIIRGFIAHANPLQQTALVSTVSSSSSCCEKDFIRGCGGFTLYIIKTTNTIIFSELCVEMGSSYTTLLMHAEVRLLSRDRISVRVLTLCPRKCRHPVLTISSIFHHTCVTLCDSRGKHAKQSFLQR
jgi:hypothetical protein